MADSAMKPLRLFILAGEPSGDQLGAALIKALRSHLGRPIDIAGSGGDAMEAEGVSPVYPLTDVSVMGIVDVFPALPRIIKRGYQVIDAILAFKPDLLITIDSPDYTKRVAARVKKKDPQITTVHYVAPSVWAWRPGRAKAMAKYIDAVLALLPFEPKALADLKGPPCYFVGHPLAENKALGDARATQPVEPPTILVLPGSRRNEIKRHMGVLGKTVEKLKARFPQATFVTPSVPYRKQQIEDAMAAWPVKSTLVVSDEDKYRAFGEARAALAASGTVTLELALARVPMTVFYDIDWYVELSRHYLMRAHSIVLANLIVGENGIPERLYKEVNSDQLFSDMVELIEDGEPRHTQLGYLDRMIEKMRGGEKKPDRLITEAIRQIAQNHGKIAN